MNQQEFENELQRIRQRARWAKILAVVGMISSLIAIAIGVLGMLAR